jgi:hypothetical protein
MSAANYILLEEQALYSTIKLVFKCKCCNAKHAKLIALQTAQRRTDPFACRVCSGKGSKHERLLYYLLDYAASISLYAVEAVAIGKKIQLNVAGSSEGLWLNRHRWDAMLLQPHSLLIEVQGEQHIDTEDGRRNNRGDTLAIRQAKDEALATAALAFGFSVLWLHPGDADDLRGRAVRWAAGLQLAVQHVTACKPPKLFKA